jgi:hypothetical protein
MNQTENHNVLLSGRLHLSKFPDGRPRDISFSSCGSGYLLALLLICSDVIGWIKAIGVLAYLIFQGRGMAERNVQQVQQARDELRRVVGFSAADEIEKLDRLKKAGSISDAEFIALVTLANASSCG